MIDKIRVDTGTQQSVDILKNGVKLIVVEKPNDKELRELFASTESNK
jgi:hypothetical protein